MKRKLKDLLPVGIRPQEEVKPILIGLIGSALFSQSFWFSYFENYNRIIQMSERQNQVYYYGQSAVMNSFAELFGHCMIGFLLIAVSMLVLAVFHYLYHYQGSKSIYRMKCLPDRWELLRRCLSIPVLVLLLCVLLVLVLTLLYYGIYLLATPRELLPPGSEHPLQNLFKNLLPFLGH